MIKTLHGTVRGNHIEIEENLGLADGEQVEVKVTIKPARKEPWGEGIKRSAGALASEWNEEDDRILK